MRKTLYQADRGQYIKRCRMVKNGNRRKEKKMIGYTWAITLSGFGTYQPTEEIFSTIEDLISSITTYYPEYQDYYGIDKVQLDENGFVDFLEEIKPIPKIYYEGAD